MLQVKWLTSSSPRRGLFSAEDRAEIARAVSARVKGLVEKEHEVYAIRDKQRQSLLEVSG